MAEVKEQLNDWSTSNKINQLLRPVEYTRLDGIVELLFAAKQDLQAIEEIVPPTLEVEVLPTEKIAPGELEKAREETIRRIGDFLSVTLLRRGKAIRASVDGKIRLVCLASQRYNGPAKSDNYWYGFTLAHRAFLADAEVGYVAFVCATSAKVYLIPREEFIGWLPDFWTSPPEPESAEDIRHWHVYFNDFGDHVDLAREGGGTLAEMTRYLMR